MPSQQEASDAASPAPQSMYPFRKRRVASSGPVPTPAAEAAARRRPAPGLRSAASRLGKAPPGARPAAGRPKPKASAGNDSESPRKTPTEATEPPPFDPYVYAASIADAARRGQARGSSDPQDVVEEAERESTARPSSLPRGPAAGGPLLASLSPRSPTPDAASGSLDRELSSPRPAAQGRLRLSGRSASSPTASDGGDGDDDDDGDGDFGSSALARLAFGDSVAGSSSSEVWIARADTEETASTGVPIPCEVTRTAAEPDGRDSAPCVLAVKVDTAPAEDDTNAQLGVTHAALPEGDPLPAGATAPVASHCFVFEDAAKLRRFVANANYFSYAGQ